MLIAARLLALVLGAFMVYFVLSGMLAYPEFTVPDLMLGGFLILAAVLPGRLAPGALIAAGAFALGVFAVAVSNQLDLGRPVNPPLIVTIATAAATLLLATATVLRNRSVSHPRP